MSSEGSFCSFIHVQYEFGIHVVIDFMHLGLAFQPDFD
jgi:hypothetical protein